MSDDGASAQMAAVGVSVSLMALAVSLALTVGVRARLDLVEQFHVGNVVNVDPLFEDDDQSPPVQLDGEDGRRERQLADGRLALSAVRVSFDFGCYWQSRHPPWC